MRVVARLSPSAELFAAQKEWYSSWLGLGVGVGLGSWGQASELVRCAGGRLRRWSGWEDGRAVRRHAGQGASQLAR